MLLSLSTHARVRLVLPHLLHLQFTKTESLFGASGKRSLYVDAASDEWQLNGEGQIGHYNHMRYLAYGCVRIQQWGQSRKNIL
jgi:hypothetical protein